MSSQCKHHQCPHSMLSMIMELKSHAAAAFQSMLRQPGPPIWSIHPEAIGHTRPYLETFRHAILPIFPVTTPQVIARIEKLIDEERYLDLAAGTTFIYQAAAFGALHRALQSPGDPCPAHLSKVAQFRLWASQSEGMENQKQYDYTGTGLRNFDHIMLFAYWDVLVGSRDEMNYRRNTLEEIIMNLKDTRGEDAIPFVLCGELIRALGSKNMRQYGRMINKVSIPRQKYQAYRTQPDIAASLVNRLSILNFQGNLSTDADKTGHFDFLTLNHVQQALPRLRMPYHCNPESLFIVERKYATLSRFITSLGNVSTSFYITEGTEVSPEAQAALCIALQTSFYEAIAKSLAVTFGFKTYPSELEYEVLCMLAERCQASTGFYRLSSINGEIYAIARLHELYKRDPSRVNLQNVSRLQQRFFDFLKRITPRNTSRPPKVRSHEPPHEISDPEDEHRPSKRRKVFAQARR